MKPKIHRIIILSVVLYVSETWPLTLRAEHRLRVLEKRVQRKVFEINRRNQQETRENCKIRR